jgi:hypothetical protein
VLRPGGTVVITHSLVWEYSRDGLERRYTGSALAALFEGWQEAKVVGSGGRAVAWATQTGRIANLAEERLPRIRMAERSGSPSRPSTCSSTRWPP